MTNLSTAAIWCQCGQVPGRQYSIKPLHVETESIAMSYNLTYTQFIDMLCWISVQSKKC